MRKKPTRVYFVDDDPAELWSRGQTADDLGPESPGSPVHLLRLDHFDEAMVSLEDPYGRGLIKPLLNEDEEKKARWSDDDLDAYLDAREENE
jgi:hypothetical protein